MLEDDLELTSNPVGTLAALRVLGVQRVRVAIRWYYIAPRPNSARAPSHFNWAEYISWRNPRIASFFQYLLHDPLPSLRSDDWGGFASGLRNYNRKAKATYAAWRLPLYMPVTRARRGQRLEVWGCARAARYAILDTGLPQTVRIELQPRGRGGFETIRSATISRPTASCYFDLRVRFPTSGIVRLSWPYPTLDSGLGYFDPLKPHTAHSRSVSITIR